jgi:hypothetical protein
VAIEKKNNNAESKVRILPGQATVPANIFIAFKENCKLDVNLKWLQKENNDKTMKTFFSTVSLDFIN